YTAIKIVERVWESHLTPTEVAALADKASQSRDPGMVEAAAKLALSVLPKAYALTAAESQKALHQCKEQSSEMLEKACKAVEQVGDLEAAEKDGVYPEVLFKVARHWYELFCESETTAQQHQQQPVTAANSLTNTPLQSQSPVAQFPPSITQTQSGGETLPPQLHQVFYPTNGTMLQIPQMQFTQLSLAQQLPFQQASYYRFPPQHPSATQHPSALSHRSASLFMQPINTAQQQQQQQQQLIMPYGPRGPLPPPPATSSSAVVVSGMHLNASMQLGQTSSAQQQQQQTSSVGMIQSG
ncbi:unnamed protein product, partial [Anisakis simplex]|uniref:Cyclin_C domain-containing protein n=1 Tax=Anisakis simplex TaxID=6269 RepID=A0A0M3KGB5_ANISI